MTIREVSERYNIPMKILKEYESWEIDGSEKKTLDSWQYDDTDLERLSLIMSLYNIGFENPEVKSYMKLLEQKGTEIQRMRILDKKRCSILDQIHSQEKLLEQLDYLRYHIRKQQEAKKILKKKQDKNSR